MLAAIRLPPFKSLSNCRRCVDSGSHPRAFRHAGDFLRTPRTRYKFDLSC